MCGGLSSHVVCVLLECDVRTPEHVRARKKHFLRARVLKKINVHKPKHHRKKHKKRFWRSRLRAKQTSCCLFCLPVFCRRETSRRSSHLCFSEKKTQNMQTNQFFIFCENASFVLCACDLRPISFGMTSFHHMRWGCVLMMRGGESPVPADKAFPLFDRTPTAQRGEKCRTFFFFY